MTSRNKQLQELAQIVDAVFSARQAAMATLRSREAEIRATLDALDEGIKARQANSERPFDPARRAGADPLWQQWISGRKRDLNADLARNLVQQDRARRTLAVALGRSEATAALVARSQDDRARKLARREEPGR